MKKSKQPTKTQLALQMEDRVEVVLGDGTTQRDWVYVGPQQDRGGNWLVTLAKSGVVDLTRCKKVKNP